MADIGSRDAVPGANDNGTAVVALLALARRFLEEPPEQLRVILLSTGSEESFSEGMQAWARRHFPTLPRDRTHVICVDTVGSPTLLVLQGEGMLGIEEYPKDLIATIVDCASDLGIDIYDRLRFRNATDGVIALKAGYPTAMIGSVDEFKIPSNYHWPTDTAENVDFGTVADAARLCDELIRRLAGESAHAGERVGATASRTS
jgi:Zn-dependent M28 family amino/carboxypeptidase